jgi:hypothetical protein
MNRLKLTLFFGFVLWFSGVSVAWAASGACSSHGGVDCSAGADYDGSVICNDGWRGSSVSYSSMVMCSNYSSPSYYAAPSIPTCPLMSSYDSLSGSCKCMYGYVVENDIFGNQSCVSGSSVCRKELGIWSRYNGLSKKCECDYGYTIFGGKCVSEEDRCQDLFGYGARHNSLSNQCECKVGYTFDGNSCSLDLPKYSSPTHYPPVSNCPLNAELKSDGSCYCKAGYQLSLDKMSCVAVSCGSNSVLLGSSCVCNDGYININGSCISHTQNCQNSFGSNSYGTKGLDANSSCYCNDGYDWSIDRSSCVLKSSTQQAQSIVDPGVDMIGFCKTNLGINAQFNSQTGNCECSTGFLVKDGKCVSGGFVGIPKNKSELAKCLVVGSKTLKKYYLKGSPTIMKLNIKNVQCYLDEVQVKSQKYIKSK